MRRAAITLALLLSTGTAAAQGFDGAWQTTLSCENARGALGYSVRFTSLVRAGVLHGEHGRPGEPASLSIDGPVAADGTARLYVSGRTGSPDFVPGGATGRGTPYGYDVSARFTAATGSGTRLEGRPCTIAFVRS